MQRSYSARIIDTLMRLGLLFRKCRLHERPSVVHRRLQLVQRRDTRQAVVGRGSGGPTNTRPGHSGTPLTEPIVARRITTAQKVKINGNHADVIVVAVVVVVVDAEDLIKLQILLLKRPADARPLICYKGK